MDKQTKDLVETTVVEKSENLPDVLPQEESKLEKALSEIDFSDRSSIIYFGTSTQEQLDEISNRMIDGVRIKILGCWKDFNIEMGCLNLGVDIDEA